MKVLIGCEFSGIVRDSFIKSGHDALSCDLEATEKIGPHYHGDIFDLLKEPWDLIIAHPPCTALTVAGNGTYGKPHLRHNERIEAVRWTEKLWDTCKEVSPKVCFENPVGVLTSMSTLPKAKYIQPYQFGHTEQKKTGLFLYNLPPLIPTNNVYYEMMKLPKKEREKCFYASPGKDRWKIRSLTYQGIANAMANQWG